MKRVLVLFCLFFLLLTPAFAKPPNTKNYCSADQIVLTDTAILVHYNETIYEIDSLRVDQGGIYFTDEMLRCINCRKTLNPKNTCECLCTTKG